MDVIKYLIGFFFKLAFGAIFVALVWWLVALLFPALSFSQVKQLIGGEGKQDLLPSPRKYSNMIKPAPTPYASATPVMYGKEFNGYGVIDNSSPYAGASFVSYSYSNGSNGGANQAQAQQPQAEQPNRSLYIRNLSIYEGGNISRGLTFIGEARNEMYKNGTFNVLVINKDGMVLGTSQVRATGAWSIPGWSRFEVTIAHPLPPNGAQCAVIFEQARIQGDTQQPVRVGIPVKCN
jgi:hypothetical protein